MQALLFSHSRVIDPLQIHAQSIHRPTTPPLAPVLVTGTLVGSLRDAREREQVIPGEKRPGAPGYFSVGPSLHQALSHRLLEVREIPSLGILCQIGKYSIRDIHYGVCICSEVFTSGFSFRGFFFLFSEILCRGDAETGFSYD